MILLLILALGQGSSLCRWAVNVIWEMITLFLTAINSVSELEWSGDFPVAEGRLKPISDTAAVKRGQVKWESERLQSAGSSSTSVKRTVACSLFKLSCCSTEWFTHDANCPNLSYTLGKVGGKKRIQLSFFHHLFLTMLTLLYMSVAAEINKVRVLPMLETILLRTSISVSNK